MRVSPYLMLVVLSASSALPNPACAQQGMTIHTDAAVHAHESSGMGIYLDVNVDGTFKSSRTSSVNRPIVIFSGQTFEIEPASGSMESVPVSNLGAEFVFRSTSAQILRGGATGLSDEDSYFPNLTIENPNNLYLDQNQAGVRNTLKLSDGKLVLEQQDFVVGTTTSDGSIEAYDQNRYIVTNGTYDQDSHGFLVRYLSSTESDWPIGSSETNYMPARLSKASGTDQQVKIRVWEGTSTIGYGVPDINNESCGATWDVSPTGSTEPVVDMVLGHPINLEGPSYAIQRHNAYLTHYVGAAPNMAGGSLSFSNWDMLASGDVGSSCDVTTGADITTHVIHKREGVDSFSPFSKAVTSDISPLPVELLSFEAHAQNQDSKLDWITATEINNSGFEIEHSTDGLSFDYVDFVPGSGGSSITIRYEFLHEKPGTGLHYYRLKQIDYDGQYEYSPVRTVLISEDDGDDQLVAYPNPGQGPIKIERYSGLNISHISIYSGTGALIYDSPSHNLPVINIDLSGFAVGRYLIIANKDPRFSMSIVKE